MRILHTSDWHLGKSIYGHSLLDDQRAFFHDCFFPAVQEEKPDVVLVAGDLFDRQIPPAAAVRLLDEVTGTLSCDLRVPAIFIAGNHDGPDRISIGLRLLREKGLYIVPRAELAPAPITLEDAFGPVHFYPLPYFDAAYIREICGEETIRTTQDAFRLLLDGIRARWNPQERNVLISHCFVSGAQPSDSESSYAVGGAADVAAEAFEGFDYVALGHLHRLQRTAENVYYSGSPLKFSFDEAEHRKGLLLVELGEKGRVEVRELPVRPPRDMRVLAGSMEALAAQSEAYREDYIYALVEEEGPVFEPMSTLRQRYPYLLGLRQTWYDRQELEARERMAAGEMRRSTDAQLFSAFVEYVTGGQPTPRDGEIFDAMMRQTSREATECGR